jgi:hypothetical protein
MNTCQTCKNKTLVKNMGIYGTPLNPISCKLCGTEFHSKYFWVCLPLVSIFSIGIYVLLVDYSIYRAVAASISVFFSAYFILLKFDAPKKTHRNEKIILNAIIAVALLYFIYDLT